MKVVESGNGRVLVGYSCPLGHLSMLILYADDVNLQGAQSFFLQKVGAANEDVRLATRFSWDLGLQDESPGRVMRVAYWRQNYRRTQSDDPNRAVFFLCGRCKSIFQQPLSSKETLCPSCRGV